MFSKDNTDTVRAGYNKIADSYSSTRDWFKNLKYLEKLSSLLKPGSTVLDIGYGELLNKINSFLPVGALILITMGGSEWEGTEEFHGEEMFWSHFGPEKNKKLVEKAGFEIRFDEIDSSGEEKHQIILARKTINL